MLQNNIICSSEELSLKSFFVGPQAENETILYNEINMVLNHWINWRKECYPEDGISISSEDQANPEFQKNIQEMRAHTQSLLDTFSQEIPKFSPRYLGHMFSEISLPSIIGHIIALLHNPNNISKESSRVGINIEKQAIRYLSQMVGYGEASLGHFTSGGTVANFEAVVRAKKKITNNIFRRSDNQMEFNDACYTLVDPGNSSKNDMSDIEIYKYLNHKYKFDFEGFTLLVPDSKHYSWTKAASLFGMGAKNLTLVNLNKYGQMCTRDLEKKINNCLAKKIPIVCLTSVLGTTELGTIDSIAKITEVIDSYKKAYGFNFWHHIDAAYGGFFACLKDNPVLNSDARTSIQAVPFSQSITIDPHKLGYVPYAAGVFLCNNPDDYYGHEISAPYVDFELQRDPGPYTIEGSRSATGPVALYLTAKCIGLNNKGYGKILERTILAAETFCKKALHEQLPILLVKTKGTNIICFSTGKKGDALSDLNKKTELILKKMFKKQNEQYKNIFYISKTHLGPNYKDLIAEFCESHGITKDCEDLHLARLTIMNPFVISKHSKINYIDDCIKYLKSFMV